MTELLLNIIAGVIALSMGVIGVLIYTLLDIKNNIARTYRAIRRARRLQAKRKARMIMHIPDAVITTLPQVPTTAKSLR
jgi:hypothetical protein